MEMVPATFSVLTPLLVHEAGRSDRAVEDRIFWKLEVLFMAGLFEGPVTKSSYTRIQTITY